MIKFSSISSAICTYWSCSPRFCRIKGTNAFSVVFLASAAVYPIISLLFAFRGKPDRFQYWFWALRPSLRLSCTLRSRRYCSVPMSYMAEIIEKDHILPEHHHYRAIGSRRVISRHPCDPSVHSDLLPFYPLFQDVSAYRNHNSHIGIMDTYGKRE